MEGMAAIAVDLDQPARADIFLAGLRRSALFAGSLLAFSIALSRGRGQRGMGNWTTTAWHRDLPTEA